MNAYVLGYWLVLFSSPRQLSPCTQSPLSLLKASKKAPSSFIEITEIATYITFISDIHNLVYSMWNLILTKYSLISSFLCILYYLHFYCLTDVSLYLPFIAILWVIITVYIPALVNEHYQDIKHLIVLTCLLHFRGVSECRPAVLILQNQLVN